MIVDVIDELAKVGAAAQANLDDTVKALAQITGVPADHHPRHAHAQPG